MYHHSSIRSDAAQDARSAKEVEQRTSIDERTPEPKSRLKVEEAAKSVRILGFRELNSRRADVALVRPSVEHYLRDPNTLNWEQFLCLGMVSSRHCDIHLVTRVLESVRRGFFRGKWVLFEVLHRLSYYIAFPHTAIPAVLVLWTGLLEYNLLTRKIS